MDSTLAPPYAAAHASARGPLLSIGCDSGHGPSFMKSCMTSKSAPAFVRWTSAPRAQIVALVPGIADHRQRRRLPRADHRPAEKVRRRRPLWERAPPIVPLEVVRGQHAHMLARPVEQEAGADPVT
jgi:hypothetical protein